MSEGLKALEALNEIKDKFFIKDGSSTIGDFGLYRRLSIIETAIKTYKYIEDELGVDLITLFKAVSNPFYTRKGTYHYVGFDSIEQDSKGDWYFSTVDGDYYFKDYGKTWALTKEELK